MPHISSYMNKESNAFFHSYLKQVELSHPNAEIRLLEVFYHKIYKVLDKILLELSYHLER